MQNIASSQCVTRRCRDLERRHKLRKTGGRWIFDHATANRIFHQVFKPESLGDFDLHEA
ncbi:MAG: hypothetical protein JOZ57_13875 [Abitibacteriaceae bacterium]|nr:hypothetical protein [Abditibacteriaceae bacterium]